MSGKGAKLPLNKFPSANAGECSVVKSSEYMFLVSCRYDFGSSRLLIRDGAGGREIPLSKTPLVENILDL